MNVASILPLAPTGSGSATGAHAPEGFGDALAAQTGPAGASSVASRGADDRPTRHEVAGNADGAEEPGRQARRLGDRAVLASITSRAGHATLPYTATATVDGSAAAVVETAPDADAAATPVAPAGSTETLLVAVEPAPTGTDAEPARADGAVTTTPVADDLEGSTPGAPVRPDAPVPDGAAADGTGAAGATGAGPDEASAGSVVNGLGGVPTDAARATGGATTGAGTVAPDTTASGTAGPSATGLGTTAAGPAAPATVAGGTVAGQEATAAGAAGPAATTATAATADPAAPTDPDLAAPAGSDRRADLPAATRERGAGETSATRVDAGTLRAATVDATSDLGATGPAPTARAGAALPSAAAQRVLDIVARLEEQPPPRVVVIDTGEVRVRIGLDAGVVRMTVLGEPSEAGEDLLREAADALEADGFGTELDRPSGDGSDRGDRDRRDGGATGTAVSDDRARHDRPATRPRAGLQL